MAFDMVRTTMDGIIHFTRNGFEDFFPSRTTPYAMDPVSIWLLFRGKHTCFTHFDLNNATVRSTLLARVALWEEMLDPKRRHPPVTFLRTVIAENPEEEISLIPMFQAAISERNPTLDHRIVVCVHDQGELTQQLTPINDRAMVWSIGFDKAAVAQNKSLFDKTENGYAKIVGHAGDHQNWPPKPEPPWDTHPFVFVPRGHLSCVEGIPAFRGTCKGIGSTFTAVSGVCPHCGSASGHALTDPTAFDKKRPWSHEEDAQLLWLGSLACAGQMDRVAVVEQFASTFSRGANETLQRMMWLQENNLESPPCEDAPR